jgi:hypothetical protein
VNVCPAIVATRSVPSGNRVFCGIVTVTLPFPVPPDGVAPSPVAVHAGHAAFEAVTLTRADPPPAGAKMFVGLIDQAQSEPNCVSE